MYRLVYSVSNLVNVILPRNFISHWTHSSEKVTQAVVFEEVSVVSIFEEIGPSIGTVENHDKKYKIYHTLKKSQKTLQNMASKYNVFLLQHIHDMLTAFFKMDILYDNNENCYYADKIKSF